MASAKNRGKQNPDGDAKEMGRRAGLSRAADELSAGAAHPHRRYPMPMPALLCFSTCPDAATAERIATALVEERLAACVNILPGLRSVYRWQGQVEAADEVLLLIKTSAETYPTLQARLTALHPYELPELLAVEPATGLPAYLDWVAEQARPLD